MTINYVESIIRIGNAKQDEQKRVKMNWVLLDTETTGIIDPIYILEVYAQKMNGFNPIGDPLHIYINHKIPIPPEATAIHGYTNEFIQRVGINPLKAHAHIEEYCMESPICSHNLGYDWYRCLVPERRRLSLEPKLTKGFCTLQLFRRTLGYKENYRLEYLKSVYNIQNPKDCPNHSAKGDVLTVLKILEKEVFPLLTAKNISSLTQIKELSKKTPISVCRKQLGLESPYINENSSRSVEQVILETLAQTLDLTEVEDSKIKELDKWLSQKKENKHKDSQIVKEVSSIISEGIVSPDRRFEILDMIQPLLPNIPNITNITNTLQTKPQSSSNITKATQKQINYLKKLGSNHKKLENLSKSQASKLIDEIKGNKRPGAMTKGVLSI